MSRHDAVRIQLEGRLAQLLQRVDKIQGDLKQGHDPDWQERAIELENDDVLVGLDAMSLGEARQIRAALERIANGSYGLCSICGRPIGAERLTAVPSTATCVACAD